jgi:hypothetical protein
LKGQTGRLALLAWFEWRVQKTGVATTEFWGPLRRKFAGGLWLRFVRNSLTFVTYSPLFNLFFGAFVPVRFDHLDGWRK